MNNLFKENTNPDENYQNIYDSLNYLKKYEGFSSSEYPDPANAKPNIGYGFQNSGVKHVPNKTVADTMAINALKNKRDELRTLVDYNKLSPWGRVALDDTAYRSKWKSLVDSDFFKYLKAGDEEKAKTIYKGIKALTPDEIAEAIIFTATRNENFVIAEMVLFPKAQASFLTSFFENVKNGAGDYFA